MSGNILDARNLNKVVPSAEGELSILADLSLQLAKGDSLAIVGTSGSGKSTLLGLLAGLIYRVRAKFIWPAMRWRRSTKTSGRGCVPNTSVSSFNRSSCSTASTPWRMSCCRWNWTGAATLASAPPSCSLASALRAPAALSPPAIRWRAATRRTGPRLRRRARGAVCRRTHRQPRHPYWRAYHRTVVRA